MSIQLPSNCRDMSLQFSGISRIKWIFVATQYPSNYRQFPGSVLAFAHDSNALAVIGNFSHLFPVPSTATVYLRFFHVRANSMVTTFSRTFPRQVCKLKITANGWFLVAAWRFFVGFVRNVSWLDLFFCQFLRSFGALRRDSVGGRVVAPEVHPAVLALDLLDEHPERPGRRHANTFRVRLRVVWF